MCKGWAGMCGGGRRFQKRFSGGSAIGWTAFVSTVTPAFGGAALVAELDKRLMFDTRSMTSSSNAGLHLDTLHMLHTMHSSCGGLNLTGCPSAKHFHSTLCMVPTTAWYGPHHGTVARIAKSPMCSSLTSTI